MDGLWGGTAVRVCAILTLALALLALVLRGWPSAALPGLRRALVLQSGGAAQPPGGGCGRTLSLTPPDQREDIADILESMGAKTGAELGVQRGIFAEQVLARWRGCTQYHLVDVWAHQQINYQVGSNVDDKTHNEYLEETKARMAKFPAAVFHRMYTSDAAKLIPDGSLDFVYVDARHDYCGSRQDLELYWPKLRPGGLLAGHDFARAADGPKGGNWSLCADGTVNPGAVRGAVEDFVRGKGLDVVATLRDRWPSYMIMKPLC
ncbi:hypothetical protein Rsub_06815 [Raphidocelis subcapitata]|uniref:Uncharacterized protein n=1 Tax=Raphidocelis subcapitata TaxID=307507 RepID=A0A2V0P477_9CHLO|nr:hypothetical protein Rsub_06815 [Raphidocelis subcapitata]|eukprot:GBF93712.1 hypothetical protein Rsub_06815 [Raphidocelis subcapitata]